MNDANFTESSLTVNQSHFYEIHRVGKWEFHNN